MSGAADAILREIAVERRRQVKSEGWTPEHDDTHRESEMAKAAAAYILNAVGKPWAEVCWPWSREWWKPATPRRDFVKAAALIVAEIERLDRAASRIGDAA